MLSYNFGAFVMLAFWLVIERQRLVIFSRLASVFLVPDLIQSFSSAFIGYTLLRHKLPG